MLALQSHVNLSLGRLPHPSWSRRPGRPRGRWIDQIRNDTSQTPADLWRQPLDAVIMDERRDGPRWLCDDDDDDDDEAPPPPYMGPVAKPDRRSEDEA